jgi:hypothetical protein
LTSVPAQHGATLPRHFDQIRAAIVYKRLRPERLRINLSLGVMSESVDSGVSNRLTRIFASAWHTAGSPRAFAKLIAKPAAMLAAFAFAFVWTSRQAQSSTALTGAWASLVLFGLCGWGLVWSRIALPGVRVSLPLAAAYGVALNCALGGVLTALGWISAALLQAMTLLGLLALVATVRPRRAGLRLLMLHAARHARLKWPLWLCGGFATYWLVRRAIWSTDLFDFNINDDFVAYFSYPRRMLDTGGFSDPFSFRRMGAYGGQSFLQALILSKTNDPYRLQVFDTGICEVIVAGMVATYARKNVTAKIATLLAVLLLVTLPNLRINSASAMSGVVLIAGIMQTRDLALRDGKPHATGFAVTLAGLGAALCTLRQNYMPTAAALLGVIFIGNLLSTRKAGERRKAWLAFAVAAVASIAVLAPWAVSAFHSNHSFLFPIVKGNFNSAFELSGYNTLKLLGGRLWTQLGYTEQVRTLPLFALAGLLAAQQLKGSGYTALVLASIVGFTTTIVGFPIATAPDASRYYFANAVALALFSLPAIGARLDARHRGLRVPFALALLAIVLHLHDIKDIQPPGYSHSASLSATDEDPHRKEYAAAQQAIPRGARTLAMVEKPFWLDYARNTIDLIDIPGAASPAPGAPWLESSRALESYLVAQKIRYIVYIKPEVAQDLYRRDQWVAMRNSSIPFFATMSTYMLAVMNSFAELSRKRGPVFEGERLVVVHLSE